MKKWIERSFSWLTVNFSDPPPIDPAIYDRWDTEPNRITFRGIISCFVYLILQFTSWRDKWWTLAPIFYSINSDFADGRRARKTKQRSKLGEILDPARDLLIFLCLLFKFVQCLGLGAIYSPWLLTALLIELAIGVGGCLIGSEYRAGVHTAGKIRRIIQVGLILVIDFTLYPDFPWIAIWPKEAAFWLAANLEFTYFLIAASSAMAFYFYLRSNWNNLPFGVQVVCIKVKALWL